MLLCNDIDIIFLSPVTKNDPLSSDRRIHWLPRPHEFLLEDVEHSFKVTEDIGRNSHEIRQSWRSRSSSEAPGRFCKSGKVELFISWSNQCDD